MSTVPALVSQSARERIDAEQVLTAVALLSVHRSARCHGAWWKDGL